MGSCQPVCVASWNHLVLPGAGWGFGLLFGEGEAQQFGAEVTATRRGCSSLAPPAKDEIRSADQGAYGIYRTPG